MHRADFDSFASHKAMTPRPISAMTLLLTTQRNDSKPFLSANFHAPSQKEPSTALPRTGRRFSVLPRRKFPTALPLSACALASGRGRCRPGASSGQVEHDFDGARLSGASGTVKCSRHILWSEAKAVGYERHHIHLLAGHQVEAEGVLHNTSEVLLAHSHQPCRQLRCYLSRCTI
jgi:hypothetical protein